MLRGRCWRNHIFKPLKVIRSSEVPWYTHCTSLFYNFSSFQFKSDTGNTEYVSFIKMQIASSNIAGLACKMSAFSPSPEKCSPRLVQSWHFSLRSNHTFSTSSDLLKSVHSVVTHTDAWINHGRELALHFSSVQRWFHDFNPMFSICRLHTSICSCVVIYVGAGHRVSHSGSLWMWFRHQNTREHCDLPQQLFFSPEMK